LFFNNIINDYSPCKFQNFRVDFYKKTANDEFWGWNIDFVYVILINLKEKGVEGKSELDFRE
jgi:hypothetical protein